MKVVRLDLHNAGNRNIIFFDGVCNLCNGFVQFVIRHDTKNHFHFASLQSDAGQKLLQGLPGHSRHLDSIMFYTRANVYSESGAVLRILGKLSGVLPLLTVFLIVPKLVRDAVYKWIARNRYKWFGKREMCMIPTPELRKKFID